jgi:hypothetical protein
MLSLHRRPKATRVLCGLVAALTLALSVGSPSPALAATGSGQITATGTNNSMVTVTFSEAAVDFGTNLDPAGTASNSAQAVSAYTSISTGAYYAFDGGAGLTTGEIVTVGSNAAWDGTVGAAANSGTATNITIASGSLRRDDTAPTTYAEAAAMPAMVTTPAVWQTAQTAGSHDYNEYYALRINWTSTVGTFSSVLTYAVTQV